MPEFMSFAEANLTDFQRRLLADVRAEGPKAYSGGRLTHAIRALERAGLIDAAWADASVTATAR